MDNVKRACMAAIIAVKCGNKIGLKDIVIYDYDQGKYLSYYINDDNDNNISLFDYDRGNYIQGPLNAIFDYITSTYMSLSIDGTSFQGYDYQSNSYIVGNINDKTIYLYDYQTASYHYYMRMQ